MASVSGETQKNIWLTRGTGRAVEAKSAKDKAILGNASTLAGASGEVKDEKFSRPNRNSVTNPFLRMGNNPGTFEIYSNEDTPKHKVFSAESWLESDEDN